jgi:hypothetical protein
MTADGSRTITFDRGGPEPEWPRVGPPLRATERAGRARPVVWHYEKPFAPTAEQLAEFAGEYVCDELDVVYTLYVDGGQLKLRFKPAQRFALTPAFADGFVADGNTIRFTRNGDGRVDGLRVSAGRVIGLRFVRR